MDLAVPAPLQGKLRREWGLQNMTRMDGSQAFGGGTDMMSAHNTAAANTAGVKRKIARFCETAIYPQQLTVPRQYASTRQGCWIRTILEGRVVAGFKEPGVRVVVQENAKEARFIMSPLFDSKADAVAWAVMHTGAET